MRRRTMDGMGGSPNIVGGEYAGQDNNGGQQDPDYAEDFYILVASFGNLAALAVSNVNLQVQSDSNFEWIETTCFGVLHGQTAPFTSIPLPINISIVDSGSGRQLFGAPVPITSIAGDGKQPFIMPIPRLFKANSNISITAQSFDPTNVYDFVYLNFIGRKLFAAG